MKKYLLTYFVFGTIYLLVGLLLLFSGLTRTAVIGFILGLMLYVKGTINALTRKPGDDYRRDSIMGLSILVPGSINILLVSRHRNRLINIAKGVVMLSVFAVSIYYVAMFFTLGADAGDAAIRNAFHTVSMGIIFMFFSMIWSALESNEYCNTCDLPYTGGTFEMNWKNTKLGLIFLFVVTAILSLSLGTFYAFFT